jgi:hypothetical protein
MKFLIISILVVISTFLLTAQTKLVNEKDYDNVKMGMTLEEAEKIFGVEGTLDTTLIYIWPENNLQVEWINGKINTYLTIGTMLKEGNVNGYEKLKEVCSGPNGPLTYSKTYAEVVKLIGKEGQKPDWVRYVWWVDKYTTIKLIFKEGKVNSKEMF